MHELGWDGGGMCPKKIRRSRSRQCDIRFRPPDPDLPCVAIGVLPASINSQTKKNPIESTPDQGILFSFFLFWRFDDFESSLPLRVRLAVVVVPGERYAGQVLERPTYVSQVNPSI